jgi:hypothetical protein
VTCSAVGEGIVSTFVVGEEDPLFGGHDVYPWTGQRDSWAVWTGTSFAAPQIAGAISKRMRDVPGMTAQGAVQAVLADGVRLADYGQALVLLPGTPPATP